MKAKKPRRRWIVRDAGDPPNDPTRTLYVRVEGGREFSVWHSKEGGYVNCLHCASPSEGMRSGCDHALAAKRAIKAGKVRKA